MQAIEGWEPSTIQRILPFLKPLETILTVDNRTVWQKMKDKDRGFLLLRYNRQLETTAGQAQYRGSPEQLYGRLRFHKAGDFSMGATIEKDAGEAFEWQPQYRNYGMDFYSAYLQWQNRGIIKNMIIGDFQASFGQSLVFGGGFNLGKSAMATSIGRFASTGVSPFTSSLEFGYFQGVAVSLQLAKQWHYTQMISSKKEDGVIAYDTLKENIIHEQITFYRTGLHRNLKEMERKGQLRVTNIGANLNYRNKEGNLELGFNGLLTKYPAQTGGGQQLYQQYNFRAKQNLIFGSYFNLYFKNHLIFGEAAMNPSGGFGVIAGMTSTLSKQTQLSFLYRNYQSDFHSLYGGAFGSQSRNSNEVGTYLGISHRFSRKLELNLYFDKYRHPWLKYRVDRPSNGNDILLRFQYKKRKHFNSFLQLKQQFYEINSSAEEDLQRKVLQASRSQMSLHLAFQNESPFESRTRIQYSMSQKNGRSKGVLLAQDFRYKLKKICLDYRFAIFETDDFDTRQYLYEKDVRYAFSIPAYQGQGIRTYFLLQYKLLPQVITYIKWSQFSYFNLDNVGSGLDQIEGNKRSNIRIQLLWKM